MIVQLSMTRFSFKFSTELETLWPVKLLQTLKLHLNGLNGHCGKTAQLISFKFAQKCEKMYGLIMMKISSRFIQWFSHDKHFADAQLLLEGSVDLFATPHSV